MDGTGGSLLTIGNFASAAQLSIKALRLYEQYGILMPFWVDRATGYRYYAPEQLRVAGLIRMLRQVDMPLALIHSVIERYESGGDPAEMINAYWQEHMRRVDKMSVVVQQLLGFLKSSSMEELTMSHEVIVKTLDRQAVVSVVGNVKIDHLEAFLAGNLARVRTWLTASRLVTAGPAFGIFHGAVSEESDGPIEVCVPLSAEPAAAPPAGMSIRILPAARAACVTLSGDQADFPEVLKGYDAASGWIEKNTFRMAGPPREVWPDDPGPGQPLEIQWEFVS